MLGLSHPGPVLLLQLFPGPCRGRVQAVSLAFPLPLLGVAEEGTSYQWGGVQVLGGVMGCKQGVDIGTGSNAGSEK